MADGDALGCVTALCAGDVVGVELAPEPVPGALHAVIAKTTSTPTARTELWIHIWTIPPSDRRPMTSRTSPHCAGSPTPTASTGRSLHLRPQPGTAHQPSGLLHDRPRRSLSE